VLIIEGVTIIHVQGPLTIRPRIYSEFQRSLRHLLGALNHGLMRNDRPGPYKNREFVGSGWRGWSSFWADLSTGDLLSGPVVIPLTSRELDVIRHGHLPDPRSNQHVRAKKELFLISIQPFFLGEF